MSITLRSSFVSALLIFSAVVLPAAESNSVSIERLKDRIRFEVAGKLFTEYRFEEGKRPYFYPVLLPDGTSLTRHWPQENDIANEERDHPHHHSLWFGHGSVNGVDFWLDEPTSGKIVQTDLIVGEAQPGMIRTKNEWRLPDGKIVLTDERSIQVQPGPMGIVLDFTITFFADHGEVVFGDTKEGTMAIRVSEELRLSHRAGDKTTRGTGQILNSNGSQNENTWGQHAEWVDYFGPIGGKTVGIAVLDHPKNPRHAPRWQVRDYGLFALNPFGQHDYDETFSTTAGNFTLAAGKSTTFRYRFYFHRGDAKEAQIAEFFKAWGTR